MSENGDVSEVMKIIDIPTSQALAVHNLTPIRRRMCHLALEAATPIYATLDPAHLHGYPPCTYPLVGTLKNGRHA